MKSRCLFLIISVIIVPLCIACNIQRNENEKQVLYLFSKDEAMKSIERSDGDCSIGFICEFDVNWNAEGCVLIYESMGKKEKKQLTVGQLEIIECYTQPVTLEYEFFLANEGDEFPVSWQAYFDEKEMKKKEKDKYGTFEEYVKSRDNEYELCLIQNAFTQIKTNSNANDWYQMFLKETWRHGDVSIEIINADAELLSNNAVCLILTDNNENKMILYGFENGYIDYIKYKGKTYAGPFTG